MTWQNNMDLGTRYRQQQNKWGPSCLPLELWWRPFSRGTPNQLRKDLPSSRRHRKQRSSTRTAWLEEGERRKERAAFELISLRAHLMRTGLGRRVVHALRSGCLANTRAVYHGMVQLRAARLDNVGAHESLEFLFQSSRVVLPEHEVLVLSKA